MTINYLTGKITNDLFTKNQIKSGPVTFKNSILFADMGGNINEKVNNSKIIRLLKISHENEISDKPPQIQK